MITFRVNIHTESKSVEGGIQGGCTEIRIEESCPRDQIHGVQSRMVEIPKLAGKFLQTTQNFCWNDLTLGFNS